MKIVYIITSGADIGGAQLHVRDLTAAMQKRGHDVHLLIGAKDGPMFQLLDEVNVSYTKIKNLVREISPLKDYRCIGELKQAIQSQSPDVVHCHSSKAGILGRYAANKCGVPSVFSAHGWSFADGISKHKATAFRIAERSAAKWCDRILCGCERDRQFGIRNGVGDESKVQTIWYGIHNLHDNAMADPAASPPKMAMVARFETQKDHETLIRALGNVKDLDWSIDLLGDGSLRPKMEKLAAELGIDDRVHFLGAQPTRETLLSSQVFLLISNWEGLPLSTLEGMRVGLPLIGSDVGGMPEQITEGESGYIIPRGDVATLTTKLRELLPNADLRKKMGDNGKARFEKDFQYDRMLDSVENVYQSIAKNGS